MPGAEARHVLRRDERKVHTRLEHEPLLLGAIEIEALRVAHVVRDRVIVLGDENVGRMTGESGTDVRNRPGDRRPQNQRGRAHGTAGEHE